MRSDLLPVVLLAFAWCLGISVQAAADERSANLRSRLQTLWQTTDPAKQEAMIKRLLAHRPGVAELRRGLDELEFPPLPPDSFQERTVLSRDHKERPWLFYLPPGYRPDRPIPLLVLLHGGVSGESVDHAALRKWIVDDPLFPIAKREGWAVLFPFAQDGATWWDEIGLDNLARQIRSVKTAANIDDDRVMLAGFSDGASGVFIQAMLFPGGFAGGLAMNGHPGLGNIEGRLPTYLTNLANLPLLAVQTRDDELFPAGRIHPWFETARRAGARLSLCEPPGRHDQAYLAGKLPRVVAFLRNLRRDPAPTRVTWETAEPSFDPGLWVGIDRIASGPAAPWYEDFNPILPVIAVDLHWIADERYDGSGVKVRRVFADSLADRLGLRVGDIVTGIDDFPIRTTEDQRSAIARLRRGNPVRIAVTRRGRPETLAGLLPPPALAFGFLREAPSGMVKATAVGNDLFIETSRVAGMHLLLPPDLFDFDREITVQVDGRTVFSGRRTPDPAFLLRHALQTRDRRRLAVGRLTWP